MDGIDSTKYLVLKDGRVFSLIKNIFLKAHKTKCGYLRINLYRKKFLIHRLVAITYLPNPLNLPCVNHKDGNKENNNVDNLEWITIKDNALHSFRVLKRKHPFGEKNPACILKESDVLDILKRLTNNETIISISKIYNVHESTISNIKNGKSWNTVTGFPIRRKKY